MHSLVTVVVVDILQGRERGGGIGETGGGSTPLHNPTPPPLYPSQTPTNSSQPFTCTQLYVGRRFYIGGLAGLRHNNYGMDLLVALGERLLLVFLDCFVWLLVSVALSERLPSPPLSLGLVGGVFHRWLVIEGMDSDTKRTRVTTLFITIGTSTAYGYSLLALVYACGGGTGGQVGLMFV